MSDVDVVVQRCKLDSGKIDARIRDIVRIVKENPIMGDYAMRELKLAVKKVGRAETKGVENALAIGSALHFMRGSGQENSASLQRSVMRQCK